MKLISKILFVKCPKIVNQCNFHNMCNICGIPEIFCKRCPNYKKYLTAVINCGMKQARNQDLDMTYHCIIDNCK